MSIRVFDYLAQYHELQHELLAAVRRVFDSGSLILGPEVNAFEREFAAFLGPDMHGVGVANGTDTIALILRALGIGPGDEVITVANTEVPTVSAIRQAGATPVFCDVDADTCLLDLDRVAACLTAKTRAVIPVHLFGNVVDVPRLRALLDAEKRSDVKLVEDCAQCHGAVLATSDGDRMAGTFGDASAWSFYPTKNLGAYGDGGLCAVRDPALAATLRSVRMYGFEQHYYAEREGVNSRLDELQAAILRVKLRWLPQHIQRRRELARLYDGALPDTVTPVRTAPNARHAYHLYVVRTPDRDRLRQKLHDRGIGTGIHYPHPIHLMRGYAFLDHAAGSLPVTERLAGELLSLPMYPELPPADARVVAAAIAEHSDG
jgi:dTDP-4-amino-4,6-dideoxygalactose transaminase